MYILHLLYVIIQTFLLDWVYHNQVFVPLSLSDNARIYASPPKKKVILFLSGLYSLEYHAYMRKTLSDLWTDKEIQDEYQLMVYENRNTPSIIVADEVIDYIEKRNREMPLDELILFGFSAGGVLASHIVPGLTHLSFSKKIITYDTPFSLMTVLSGFGRSRIARMDILYYYFAIKAVYERGGVAFPDYGGVEQVVESIQKIHGFSRDEFFANTQFRTDLPEETSVLHIRCKADPIRCLEPARPIPANHVLLEKPIVGHCSDMLWRRGYMREVKHAIKYNFKKKA